MKTVLLRLFRWFVNALYTLLKLVCRERAHRVLFLSRQGNSMQLDFQMIIDTLREHDEAVECVVICRRSDKGVRSRIRYSVAFMRSLYYLATSRVCVLNSYWPVVSLVTHRPTQLVVQVWHAAGKIKQSGYQTLDRAMGHSSVSARELRMHRGYDVVIAGAKAWNPFYCASFDISVDKIANVGLPRFDYLQWYGPLNRQRFYERYPFAKGKRIVFYAPTFREGIAESSAQVVRALTADEKNMVIFRRHPNQDQLALGDRRVYRCPDFSSLQLLHVADYLITDYSAIAVEAASVGVKTLYYCFDIEGYLMRNGLNVDPRDIMPSCVYSDAQELAAALDQPYPEEEFASYCERYVLSKADLGHSTERIANMVLEAMDR